MYIAFKALQEAYKEALRADFGKSGRWVLLISKWVNTS